MAHSESIFKTELIPMNSRILDYVTVFITGLNGMFVFISGAEINTITAVFGLIFLVLRNVRFVFVLLYEIGLFLFYKTRRARIIAAWRREMKATEKTEKPESEEPPTDEPQKKV